MKGSILSRWSMMVASVLVIQACAGKGGQAAGTPEPTSEPKAAEPAPKPKETAVKPAETPKAEPAPAPATPVAPAPPAVPDSAAIVVSVCKQITDGVKAAIKSDSTPNDPNEVARKATDKVSSGNASIALAKGITCKP